MIRRLAALTALFLLLNLPAYAQNDLKAMLFGKAYPNTLALKELDGEWRVMNVGGASGESNAGAGFMAIFAMMMSSMTGTPTYYTKGDTLTIGSETFLVAYRSAVKPINMTALMMMGGRANQNPPAPEAFTPDTKIALSLVNLKTATSFTDIHAFDLKAEIEAHKAPPPPPPSAQSDTNLKQIGTALLMYVQDYDEMLPPMKKMAKTQEVLMPYIKNKDVFVNPESKEPYSANPVISEMALAKIEAPADTVVFYEAKPSKDGTRGICFADGHVKRIKEEDWPAIKAKNKIP